MKYINVTTIALNGIQKGGKSANLQEKNFSITENGETTITPDEGYNYLNRVNITTNVPIGGIDMTLVNNFSGWKFTTEQFEALNTNNWDKVTSMAKMFSSCKSLTTIPMLDTSNVTSMSSMFNYAPNLTTIPQIDTSNVTNMDSMFFQCGNLLEIPQLDTSKVTTMYNMFYHCDKLLEIPLLNTSNVTSMYGIFSNCISLTTIPLLDTSNVTTMYEMFGYCDKLLEIPLLNTSNVTSMYGMFRNCRKITTIPLLDTSKTRDIKYIFLNCSALTNLGGLQNLGISLDLSDSTLLTVDSLMNVINNLKDLTGGTAQTLTLGATNLAKLSDEQKAIATNKNWVLA